MVFAARQESAPSQTATFYQLYLSAQIKMWNDDEQTQSKGEVIPQCLFPN